MVLSTYDYPTPDPYVPAARRDRARGPWKFRGLSRREDFHPTPVSLRLTFWFLCPPRPLRRCRHRTPRDVGPPAPCLPTYLPSPTYRGDPGSRTVLSQS